MATLSGKKVPDQEFWHSMPFHRKQVGVSPPLSSRALSVRILQVRCFIGTLRACNEEFAAARAQHAAHAPADSDAKEGDPK
jgi:hypothetical protein